MNYKASFKHGKIFSKTTDAIILIFSTLLFGIIIWILSGVLLKKLSFYLIYGVVLFLFIDITCFWLVIRDLALKKNINLWIKDAIKVYAYVELINKPSIFGQMAEVRADILWKETKNIKRKETLFAVLHTALYKKYINKNVEALYSPKYKQLIFYENINYKDLQSKSFIYLF